MARLVVISIIATIIVLCASFKQKDAYTFWYDESIQNLREQQENLLQLINNTPLSSSTNIQQIKSQINSVRKNLKRADFWLRYLEPIAYKKINGPLPVEWETEVFEKFEKPYKREGAGFTLAELYLEEETFEKDSLLQLIRLSAQATAIYQSDSIRNKLLNPHHFFFCNRLFLLNLATIYTTGFECPDTSRIIPELRDMLSEVANIYLHFDESHADFSLNENYLTLFNKAIDFTSRQSSNFSQFDHFTFVKEYVNPLFIINQKLIQQFAASSKSLVDYSLNKNAFSIFDKHLYRGQNPKGIFYVLAIKK